MEPDIAISLLSLLISLVVFLFSYRLSKKQVELSVRQHQWEERQHVRQERDALADQIRELRALQPEVATILVSSGHDESTLGAETALGVIQRAQALDLSTASAVSARQQLLTTANGIIVPADDIPDRMAIYTSTLELHRMLLSTVEELEASLMNLDGEGVQSS